MVSKLIGSLLVRIGADVSDLNKGVADAKKGLGSVSAGALDAVKSLAKIGVAAAAAGAAMLAGIFTNSVKSARELEKLSRIAGETPDNFSRLAHAAKDVGVEQEKLADIFKNSQERVQEFLVTGSGPLKDFFESIGPKIGLTAKELGNLSGPEILGRVKKAMDDAGMSAAQQSLWMEKLGKDASLLSPLLANNSARLNELTAEADALGVSLSGIEVAQLEAAGLAFSKLMDFVGGLANTISVALAPIITHIADSFVDAAKDAGGWRDEIAGAVKTAVMNFGALKNLWHELQLAWDETVANILDGINYIIRAWNGLANTIPGMSRLAFGEIEHSYGKLRDEIGNPPSMEEWESWYDGLVATSREAAEKIAKDREEMLGGADMPGGPNKREQEKADRERERLAAQLEQLRVHLASEEEAEFMSYQNQLAALDEFYNQRMVSEAEYQRMIEAARQQHEENLADIRDRALQEELRARSDMANRIVSTMSALGNALSRDGQKNFALTKAISIASALIKGWESVVSSYAAGAKIGGPPLGAAYAAMAAAQTAAQIASMRSVSSSGGGSPSAASASGSSAASASTAPAREQTIFIQGLDSGAMFSGGSVRELAESLVDFFNDGGNAKGKRIVFA